MRVTFVVPFLTLESSYVGWALCSTKWMKEVKGWYKDMKKRAYLAVGLLGIVLALSGCKKEEKVISFNDYSQFKDIDTSAYVTVADYKGLNITADTIPVSEIDINSKIESVLYEHGFYIDTKEEPITPGCQIKISVKGSVDGKINDGFTSDGYEFVYGYDEHIMDGFIDNLKGLYQGDKVQFDLVVPSSFGEIALTGKTVTFDVTIDRVQSFYIPSLTDDFVKDVFDMESAEEYKASLIPEIREEKMKEIEKDKKNGIWKIVSDNSTVDSYPEGAIEAKEAQLRDRLEMYAQIKGMELEDYVYNSFGVNYDEYVKLSVKQDLILDVIGRTENITITEKEYEETLSEYVQLYGYQDEQTMLNTIGEEKVKEAILWDEVMEYVANQVTVVV